MLNKKVLFLNEKFDEEKGVVLDKIKSVTKEYVNLPSGTGGTIRTETPIAIDYYLIQAVDNKIKKVRCDYITQVLE